MTHPRNVAVVCACAALMSSAMAAGADPQASVVRITTEMRLPNPLRPWTRQNPVSLGGSGVVLDGKRILTNAHLALYATEIWIQDRAGDDRYSAKVAGVGSDIDLAVLTLDDESFFDDHPPLPRAEGLPKAMSQVVVYGFPIGGNGLSVTSGIISRIAYADPAANIRGLVLQVDAALNPGNSGGPALVDDRMVGIASSRLIEGENIGYIIPNQEIDAFLADVADGKYRGKPSLDASVQTLENPALREKLGIDRTVRGVMIARATQAEGDSILRPFDVLTHIGGKPIDNEGMIKVEQDLRLPFYYLIANLERDGHVPITVVREGKPLDLSLPVEFGGDSLIPSYQGEFPPYFVCGPLVFAPVRREAVAIYHKVRPDLFLLDSPLRSRAADRPRFEGEELVVITVPMLPHPITRGYNEPFGQVVHSVNGVEIRNLRHLVEVLRDSEDPFLTIRFAEQDAELLVFRRQELLDATEAAMLDGGIPRRGSEDMIAIWDAGRNKDP